jgi:hypothetical protein
MQIEIDTYDPVLSFDLMEDASPEIGQAKEAPGRATISLEGIKIQESAGVPDTITLVVSFVVPTVTSIGINLFSSWLYDKLSKSKVKTVRIERKEVRIEKEELTRTIEETVRRIHTIYTFQETTRIEE